MTPTIWQGGRRDEPGREAPAGRGHALRRSAGLVDPAGRRRVARADCRCRIRLDDAEAQLAQARASLVEGYGCWRRALEDVENLWALAAWRSTAAEEASEHPGPLAA